MSRLFWKAFVSVAMRLSGPRDALFLVQPGAEVKEFAPFAAKREVGPVGGLAVGDGLTALTALQDRHGISFSLGEAKAGRRRVLWIAKPWRGESIRAFRFLLLR